MNWQVIRTQFLQLGFVSYLEEEAFWLTFISKVELQPSGGLKLGRLHRESPINFESRLG